MKALSKKLIAKTLGKQVRRLRKQHDFKIVAVVGSIGKTSTKFAVAKVLEQQYRVRFQEGNYNDIISVPLVFFGLEMPNIFNPAAWAKLLANIKRQLKKPYPYDVVVVELGTDGPGQIAAFKDYVEVDIAIVSAITPEHMEFFSDMRAVAKEELSVSKFSETVIINRDLADERYFTQVETKSQTYGVSSETDYRIRDISYADKTAAFAIEKKGKILISAKMDAVSVAEIYSATAATVVADILGVSSSKIEAGIAEIKPVSGRMQRLAGIHNSLIIDETYNASPEAVKVALDSLYEIKAKQKIALLGNMNELGSMSPLAHTEIGEYCEPEQLDVVVTIGTDANSHLAKAAKKRGCKVESFTDPYSAGKYIKDQIKDGAVILAKGSQNGVFAEEAVKQFLADSSDQKLLVRQTEEWLKKKQKQFGVVL